MDFLVGFLIYVVGAIVGIVFMVFAPSEIRKKITDTLNSTKEKSDVKIVSTTSSSSSYFDKGSGSSFLISSSSNL
jgi:uncharacterized membrane-anchored protein YhcB (DUF1043 family)